MDYLMPCWCFFSTRSKNKSWVNDRDKKETFDSIMSFHSQNVVRGRESRKNPSYLSEGSMK